MTAAVVGAFLGPTVRSRKTFSTDASAQTFHTIAMGLFAVEWALTE